MKSRTNGFTLIELMVVIVIMGILAAIAIPKMFGMTAKAKASEVGPAVGSWSKLAQAYFGETSSIGTWLSIGYQAPGDKISAGNYRTSYVLYNDPDVGTQPTISHWQATAQKISESCDGQIWAAQFDGRQSTATQLGCADLTPNFKKLQ